MVDTLICRTLQVHLIVCALRFKMPGSVPGLVPGRNDTLTAMAIFTGSVGVLSAGGVRVTVRSCFFFCASKMGRVYTELAVEVV